MEILFHSGDEECLTRVTDVRTYDSFEDLLEGVAKKREALVAA